MLMANPKEKTTDETELRGRAAQLGLRTNSELRAATYRALLLPSKEEQRNSDWTLLVTGTVLTLILSNLKDLLEVFNITDLRVGMLGLLASAIAGLAAK